MPAPTAEFFGVSLFGLAGNKVLLRRVGRSPRMRRWAGLPARRRKSAATAISAMPPKAGRRAPVIARVEACPQGADSRFIVTNLAGSAHGLYEDSTAPAAKPKI